MTGTVLIINSASFLLLILFLIVLGCTTGSVASAAVVGNLFYPRRDIEQALNIISPASKDFGTKSRQTCEVNGLKYLHGQQIDRYRYDVNREDEADIYYDPCVYCICVSGDMYCWWGDGHLSQCSIATTSSAAVSTLHNTISGGISSTSSSSAGSTSEESTMTALDTSLSSSYSSVAGGISSGIMSNNYDPTNNTSSSSSTQYTMTTDNNISPSPSVPTVCVVMGREYYLGEVLPHETGTCLECQCGHEGRVTCSPKDCITQQDDEFRNPSDTNSLDMFDVDIF
ncbi:uncharacterized protein LOC142330013 [Lycorma delicatula]|uniref:uncharacterized protein LOC142330013 n=1 Tax=Lycorma delicatula TaxID=130591 RepID=UPI003F51866F